MPVAILAGRGQRRGTQFPARTSKVMAPPEKARKIMDKSQDPEAADTVQTKGTPAVAPAATCSESSPQWTPRAKKMLMLARKVAITYQQNYVGSEHLLAGIIAEKEGFAARLLEAHGITMDTLVKECG